MPAIHDGSAVVAQVDRIGRIARTLSVPLVGTEQAPARLGEMPATIRSLCTTTIEKHHFDASADGLIDSLPSGRRRVIAAGCETHVCVMQTALGLMSRGFEITVVVDAVGSRKQRDRDAAINRLKASGAEMATVEMIAFEWLRDSRHPLFRDVLRLVK